MNVAASGRPIADDLIDVTPEGPRLVAGRHRESGRVVFPLPKDAEGAQFDRIHLNVEGALWTWTVQRFAPKPPFIGQTAPEHFQPYAVGYVELPGETIVETRIVAKGFHNLRVGARMRLTLETIAIGPEGAPIYTYAFEPVEPA